MGVTLIIQDRSFQFAVFIGALQVESQWKSKSPARYERGFNSVKTPIYLLVFFISISAPPNALIRVLYFLASSSLTSFPSMDNLPFFSDKV